MPVPSIPTKILADLYDELTMPMELRKAHPDDDRAVMEAYMVMRRAEMGREK